MPALSPPTNCETSPEIAESYARMVAAMGERVGWPLHVFLLPDGTPILGATYLPREDRPGRPGILTVLASVSQAAAGNRGTLERRAEDLRAAVAAALVEATPVNPQAPGDAVLTHVVESLLAETLRAETLADKPAFRAAIRRRRCLVLADGFYEWRNQGRQKTPFFVRGRSGGLLTLAGLWESWKRPDGESLRSFTIITVEPNRLIEPIHDRMPAILGPDAHDRWLEIEQRLSNMSQMQPEIQSVQRMLVSGAVEAPIDGQGRILIPPHLRDHAGLQKEVTIAGVGKRIEIWDKARFDQELQTIRDQGKQVSSVAAELGV